MQLRNHRVALRLLAQRLSPEAASRAKLRQKRKATKNGRKLCHPWSAVLADWLLVLTSPLGDAVERRERARSVSGAVAD